MDFCAVVTVDPLCLCWTNRGYTGQKDAAHKIPPAPALWKVMEYFIWKKRSAGPGEALP